MDRRVIPKQAPWDEMRAAFRWRVPERFNIARAVCDSWAAAAPDRLAVTALGRDGTTRDWTYGDLKRASDGLAAALAARGAGRGDRVAIVLPQCPEVILTHLAAMKLGAVSLPIFAAFGEEALRYRLADSGARAVVTDAGNLGKVMGLKPDLPDLAEVYCTGPAPAPVRDFWGDIAAAQAPPEMVRTAAEDPAMMIYTSGTTGEPKGVLHAHRFLIGHLPSIETTHEGFPMAGDRGWTPADWAWIGGLMDMCFPCLYHGVPQLSHRMQKFDPDRAFDLIDRFGLRNLFLPPTALKMMRASGRRAAAPVRSVSSGGESLSEDLIEWGGGALGGPINEIYGQTECNLITGHTGTTMDRRPGTMGRPVPGFDVALLDEAGRPVANGEMGEIAVRAPNPVMFLRYWNKPQETAAKRRGDWHLTGDLGVKDGDGYITYHGRNDDVITSAGYRIGPTEIENCLTGHPDVLMAAAIGVEDALRGQVVHAFVTLRGEPGEGLEAALIQRVRERVSPHVAPRRVHVIPEMPLTTTGKIMRREVRRLYA